MNFDRITEQLFSDTGERIHIIVIFVDFGRKRCLGYDITNYIIKNPIESWYEEK